MEGDREKSIAQSREFMRDNSIFRGMTGRSVDYGVGSGFKLQVNSGDVDNNNIAEAFWKEFWKKPEIRRLLSGLQCERTIYRELVVAGDTGVLKLKKGLIQLIEAEQITSRRNRSGVNLGTYGDITSFNICPYGRGGFVNSSKPKNYKVRDFIFVSDPERPSATRSVPPCQSSFPMLHRINDVCDSEAIAWQMLARLALSINRAGAADMAYGSSAEDDTKSGDDTDGDLATRVHELDSALIFHAEPGEEIKGIDRNIPGKDFPESIRMFLRLIGLPIGLPLELILLDWTKSNYSQSRAVLEQAHQTFLNWQRLLALALSEIYLWKRAQWVHEGLLASDDGTEKHDWIWPTFPWIDQHKEAQAQGTKMDRGFSTHSQVLKSLNQDRDDVVNARQREVVDAIKRAKSVEKETGEKVPWQIFAGLKAPKNPEVGRPGGAAPAMPADEKEEKD
jgi:capsid protein